jgi:hypothetical protein
MSLRPCRLMHHGSRLREVPLPKKPEGGGYPHPPATKSHKRGFHVGKSGKPAPPGMCQTGGIPPTSPYIGRGVVPLRKNFKRGGGTPHPPTCGWGGGPPCQARMGTNPPPLFQKTSPPYPLVTQQGGGSIPFVPLHSIPFQLVI